MFGIRTKKGRWPIVRTDEVEGSYIKIPQEFCPACDYELQWNRYDDCYCAHCGQLIRRDIRKKPKDNDQIILGPLAKDILY